MIYTYPARLVRVVDGDTVRLILDVGFKLTRQEDSYRLLRINAPELNTAEGKASKAALEGFLASASALVAQTQKSDNFGRWLAELWADNVNVSDWLVERGYAAYHSYS